MPTKNLFKCDQATCPACGCDGQHCMLDNLTGSAPHIIRQMHDSEQVCDKFRARAKAIKRYKDHRGCVLYVNDGDSRGDIWFTAYDRPRGGRKRLDTVALPIRGNYEDAQRDLDRYAMENLFAEVQ